MQQLDLKTKKKKIKIKSHLAVVINYVYSTMAAPKPILYATGVTICGFICLILAGITLFVPIWGYFEDRYGGYQAERGYFGPWKVCKKLNYNREICGDRFRFQVSGECS